MGDQQRILAVVRFAFLAFFALTASSAVISEPLKEEQYVTETVGGMCLSFVHKLCIHNVQTVLLELYPWHPHIQMCVRVVWLEHSPCESIVDGCVHSYWATLFP